MDTFHKGIQDALEKLGKSKFGFERTAIANFKSKKHEGSGNELADYPRAPCLGAGKKARGLWGREANLEETVRLTCDLHDAFPCLCSRIRSGM